GEARRRAAHADRPARLPPARRRDLRAAAARPVRRQPDRPRRGVARPDPHDHLGRGGRGAHRHHRGRPRGHRTPPPRGGPPRTPRPLARRARRPRPGRALKPVPPTGGRPSLPAAAPGRRNARGPDGCAAGGGRPGGGVLPAGSAVVQFGWSFSWTEMRCPLDGQAGTASASTRPCPPRGLDTIEIGRRPAGRNTSMPVMNGVAKNAGIGSPRSVTRSRPASKAKIPMARLVRGALAAFRTCRPLRWRAWPARPWSAHRSFGRLMVTAAWWSPVSTSPDRPSPGRPVSSRTSPLPRRNGWKYRWWTDDSSHTT